jgi:DNA-binding SARP family transcriptional activator
MVELANEFLDGSAGPSDRPAALVLRSRLEISRDNSEQARELAERAAALAEGSDAEAVALLNLARSRSLWGFDEVSLGLAREARDATTNPTQASIAEAFLLVGTLTKDGDLQAGAHSLRELAARQAQDGLHWYRAVTLLNQALALEWAGSLDEALAIASESEAEMARLGSKGVERAAALSGMANILAKLRRVPEAERLLDQALALPSAIARSEAAIESSRMHAALGDGDQAERMLASIETVAASDNIGLVHLTRGELALRRGDFTTAQESARSLETERCGDMAGLLRSQLLRARVALATSDRRMIAYASEALDTATRQRSRPGAMTADLLSALGSGRNASDAVTRIDATSTYVLSVLAEPISLAAPALSEEAWAAVALEASRRPQRWAGPLLEATRITGSERPAELLAAIGNTRVAAELRALAVDKKQLRPSALRITKRLAQPVQIMDLGRIEVVLGSERLRIVRRKVLGLLCLLGSRPTMAATRDEILEALWPDLKPDTAANSLHQTIYFLRRAFESDYHEGLGAGYVTYDGEVAALSDELCDSLSRRCWRTIRRISANAADPTALIELVETYRGKFALDFAYEDWTTGYRDNLHAAVLAAAEAGMTHHLARGEHEAAILIGHRILGVDADADAIELLHLRAYKYSGRHAAAAEQYGHYAAFIRDLGSEPPGFEEI